jgi:hypothetical protein
MVTWEIAPAVAPDRNLSWSCGLLGSRQSTALTWSYTKNLRADSGATFTTFTPFPRTPKDTKGLDPHGMSVGRSGRVLWQRIEWSVALGALTVPHRLEALCTNQFTQPRDCTSTLGDSISLHEHLESIKWGSARAGDNPSGSPRQEGDVRRKCTVRRRRRYLLRFRTTPQDGTKNDTLSASH